MKSPFLAIIFLFLSVFSFSKDLKVLATTTMIGDMARNIAGGKLVVESILPSGGDPHTYEPTPADAQKVAMADIVLVNGLTLEGWMKKLIDNSGTKALIITVTEGVEALKSDVHEGATDPHAWMTAYNGIIYSQNILNAFQKIDPSNKESYQKNFLSYKASLESLDNYIKTAIQQIPEHQRILITSHDAFHYFGLRYGLKLESVMGTSTDADVQTSDIIRLVKTLKQSRIPAIFIESTINPKLLKQLAKDNHVIIGGNLFADSLGDENSGASTYLDMLKHNADIISQALNGTSLSTIPLDTEGVGFGSFILVFVSFLIVCVLGVLFIGKRRI